jgi:hypothetical protein
MTKINVKKFNRFRIFGTDSNKWTESSKGRWAFLSNEAQ